MFCFGSRRSNLGVVPAVACLALAGCGSGAQTSSTASGGTASAASSSAITGASAGGYPPGCHPAPAPTARGATQLPRPAARLPAGPSYTVRILTNCGEIDIALDVKQSPRTAASFASLVRRGFFDGLGFHRVAAGFVIQGGDPAGNGSGGPGYQVVEAPPPGVRYTVGSVAMAKTAADPVGASGSQFFIVIGSQAATLPPQYALLGHVVAGQQVANAIGQVATSPPGDGAPVAPVVMSRVTLSG